MIYLILAIIILGLALFISIKSNIKKSGEIKSFKKTDKIVTKVETQKTDIRNEANETENDIDNSDNITNGVMPINGAKQSGNFRDTRGKGSTINS